MNRLGKRSRPTLKSRLFWTFLPLVLVAAGAPCWLYYRHASAMVLDRVEIDHLHRAVGDARTVGALIDRVRSELLTLARVPSVKDYYMNKEYGLEDEAGVSRADIERFIREIIDRSGGLIVHALYADGHHNTVVQVPAKAGRGSFDALTLAALARPCPVAAGVGGATAAGKGGETLPIDRLPITGRVEMKGVIAFIDDLAPGRSLLRMAIPLRDGTGIYQGFLALDTDLGVVLEPILSFGDRQSSYALLINKNGGILFGPPSIALGRRLSDLTPADDHGTQAALASFMKQRGARVLECSIDGLAKIVALASIEPTSWSLAICQDRSELVGRLWDVQRQVSWLLGMVGFIGVLTLAGLASSITTPIRALTDGAKEIGAGLFATRLDIEPNAVEIEVLRESFNQMAENLERLDETNRRYIEYLRSMQSQLVQAEKLSAMGRLTAGIAHEINTPLTTIISSVCVLEQRFAAAEAEATDPLTARALLRVREGALHAEQVIRGLLDYSRKASDAISLIPTDVNDVVERALELIGTLVKDRQVDLSLAAQRTVLSDPVQLQQALVNLITNAVDATAAGGRIGVSTFDHVLTEDEVYVRTQTRRRAHDEPGSDFRERRATEGLLRRTPGPGLEPGAECVVIEVSDMGEGVSPENMTKIFDPFFTTKGVGKGTGLGLSITLGIVKQHGGLITGKSRLGQGATFTVKLPAARAKTRAAP